MQAFCKICVWWENHFENFQNGNNQHVEVAEAFSAYLRVCLNTAYVAETKKLLLKVLLIKVKVSWNSIVRSINSAKKCSEVHK